MYRSVLAVSLILLMAAAPVPQPAAGSAAKSALSCISKSGNAKITTNVTGTPKSVRVYFKGEGAKSCGEYFVDMKPNDLNSADYSGLLPPPDATTTAVTYQVRIDYGNGKVVTQDVTTVPVKNECAAQSLTSKELKLAKNIVLGLTSAGQSTSPCGFRCTGVTSALMPNNVLQPNEACRVSLIQKTLKGAEQGEPGATAMEVAAGLLFVGGAFAFQSNRNNSNQRDRQPSPSRP